MIHSSAGQFRKILLKLERKERKGKYLSIIYLPEVGLEEQGTEGSGGVVSDCEGDSGDS